MSEQKPRELFVFQNDGVALTKEEINKAIASGPPAIWHESGFTKYVIADDYDRLRERAERLAEAAKDYHNPDCEVWAGYGTCSCEFGRALSLYRKHYPARS